MSSAVRTAVPLGESTFVSRCASTISIDGKNGAAAAASAEPSTEPSEKFGMNTAPVPAASTSGRTSAMRSADHPEVPTRTLMPRSIGGADDVDRHGRRRGVDDEIRAVQLGELGPRRERRDQLEAVRLVDHPADDPAELAGAAHDGHARRHAVHPRRARTGPAPRAAYAGGVVTLRQSPVDAPDAHALLAEYFSSREIGFAHQNVVYTTTFPAPVGVRTARRSVRRRR